LNTKKLYVGNLNYSANDEDLKALFVNYGEVSYVRVLEGRGFGFVEMSTVEEAEKAMSELNNQEFMGRVLKVAEARPQNRQRDQ
jgi:RNA recognition motif-containing protein